MFTIDEVSSKLLDKCFCADTAYSRTDFSHMLQMYNKDRCVLTKPLTPCVSVATSDLNNLLSARTYEGKCDLRIKVNGPQLTGHTRERERTDCLSHPLL